jgi:hypothetical protein
MVSRSTIMDEEIEADTKKSLLFIISLNLSIRRLNVSVNILVSLFKCEDPILYV